MYRLEGVANTRSETRKIQVVGGSTFAVSLPKPWVDAVRLGAGDEVLVQPRADGSLLIEPRVRGEAPPQQRVVEADAISPEELLRLLVALYVAGADVVVLKTKAPVSPSLRASVDAACALLLGVRVVDETPTSLTLQDLADLHELNMRNGLRMMHLNARRMLQAADRLLSAAEDTAPSLAELERCEAELDRLFLLLVKHNNRLLHDLTFSGHTGVTVEESLPYMFAAQYLERVGDYAYRVARDAGEMGPQERVGIVAARSQEALRGAGALLDEAVRAFERNDSSRANGVIEDAKRFSKETRAHALGLLDTPRKPALLPARRLFLGYFSVMESAERIALYAKSIAEVAINKAVATGPTLETLRGPAEVPRPVGTPDDLARGGAKRSPK